LSKKVRVDNNLIAKAEEVFAKAKKKTIVASKDLTRTELRALERKGIVTKVPIHQASKYVGETGALYYGYQLVPNYPFLVAKG